MEGGYLTEFPQLDNFFADILNLLTGMSTYTGFVESPSIDAFAADIGLVRVGIENRDRSQLHVGLVVDYSDAYPRWLHYSFHLQDRDGRCIFRYDNERHYPNLPYFPSHKHIGPREEVVPWPQPSVRAIRAEVEAIVSRNLAGD